MEVDRRRFLTYVCPGFVGVAGCTTGGLSPEVKEAVRTFNSGVELQEQAQATAEDAADSLDAEAFEEAEQSYTDAERLYERAGDKFSQAREGAGACDRVAKAADDMLAHVSASAEAMGTYAEAAHQYALGNDDEGDDLLAQAEQANETAEQYDTHEKFDLDSLDSLNCSAIL